LRSFGRKQEKKDGGQGQLAGGNATRLHKKEQGGVRKGLNAR